MAPWGSWYVIRDRIVFWQVRPSPHQAPFVRALAEALPKRNTVAVFQQPLNPHRLAMGWHQPDYGNATVIVDPDSETVERLVADNQEKSVHIFSSMSSNASINKILQRCVETTSLIGILSEGRDPRGVRGFLRRVHSVFHERSYLRHIDFVLAIGHVGESWFGTCGYAQKLIFPFGYVVEKPPATNVFSREKKMVVLTFVGQIIRRKRVDLLLHALALVTPQNWTLQIVGDGGERPNIERLTKKLNLSGNVSFLGVIDNSEVREILSKSDVLVLPSRFDGWGAVANESLMCGTPVICSDYCGVASLLADDIGAVFNHGSVRSLANKLEEWIKKGCLDATRRERIRNWSGCIEGPTMARYVLDVIRFVEEETGDRPRPPWTR